MQFNASNNMKPWQGIFMGLICFLIGAGLLWLSANNIIEYRKKNNEFTPITSTVVDYNYNDDGLKAIIVEYSVKGKSYRKTSGTYSTMPQSVGSSVELKYNQNDPQDSIWVNDSTNMILPLVGGLFAVIGVFIVISSIKKMRNGDGVI